MDDFFEMLKEQKSDDELYDFCRKYVLHGIPYVFENEPDKYYDFRKKIAQKFKVSFHEIYITGSGKLGFSPIKRKKFDYDSDIDVAIISTELFEKYMGKIAVYQGQYRRARAVVREDELKMYHAFLEYIAIGWLRPDKLPISFQMKLIKDDWFNYFNSISNGKSEIGNYKVSAGVFKSYKHLEDYIVSGLKDLNRRIEVRK